MKLHGFNYVGILMESGATGQQSVINDVLQDRGDGIELTNAVEAIIRDLCQ